MATELDQPLQGSRCPACSAPSGAGWAVCIYCGVVLQQQRLDLRGCGACRSIVMAWQQFCMRCGSPMDAGEVVGARIPAPAAPSSASRSSVSAPPVPEEPEQRALELLLGIRSFLLSRTGVVAGVVLLILAVAPWFIQGDQVIVRLIVPASGRTIEKSVGDVVQVEAIVLNAEAGSVLTVSVDGRSLGTYQIGTPAEARPELAWKVEGAVGTLHEFTVELVSPDGDRTLGAPATVAVTEPR